MKKTDEDAQKTIIKAMNVANRPDSEKNKSNAENKGHPPPNQSPDVTKYKAPQRGATPDKTRIAAAKNLRGQPVRDPTRISAPNNQTRIKQPGAGQSPASNVDTPAGNHIRILKNRFILESVLGVGGMGVVYKAKDKLKVEAQDRDPYVAIKVLSEEFKTHPEAFIALQRESRKAQRIAHPNTVKVYDFDRDGDVVFMTMEYMVGKPLDQLIKQYHSTGLPRDDAWNILFGMCSALEHAHNENIVHSDFKPGNVFVTDSGMAKIFDFGIARAVANIDRTTGKAMDRTVFDAGSLGALTPAYASMEMLQGKTPDTRDDIYALGCIAYEILTGEHPYNRLPADEAYSKKLKLKRITDINKTQWKAIEKALAFKREDRIESVEDFHHLLVRKYKPTYLVAAVLLLLLVGSSIFLYTQYFSSTTSDSSQADMRSELEYEIRYKLFKENIDNLLANPTFSPRWEADAWNEFRGMGELFQGKFDKWFVSARGRIYKLYVNEIRSNIKDESFDKAQTLLEHAYRYTDDTNLLDNEKIKLANAIEEKQEREKQLARTNSPTVKINSETTSKPKKNTGLFDVALGNVTQQLQCQSRINMRDFKIAITKLRNLDYARYKKLEEGITTTLARCITAIGQKYPEQAIDAKRYASLLFKGDRHIAAIVILPRDPCDMSIAGLGARGDRTVCRDKLGALGSGPALVVVPGSGRIKPFAIGKYELTVGELNVYCNATKQCKPINVSDDNLPATKVDINLVSDYLKWLSTNTRKKYRLPTKQEWVYAANSKTSALDPNRNCQLATRGIQKGEALVRVVTGRQNAWGLVNHAGNAQELVYDSGRKLTAVGGSYQSAMDKCNINTQTRHSGNGDEITGFRVLREVDSK